MRRVEVAADELGIDRAVDHGVRDVDALGPQLAGHALRQRAQHPGQHRFAADLDQRLALDAVRGGQRIAAGARTGKHQSVHIGGDVTQSGFS